MQDGCTSKPRKVRARVPAAVVALAENSHATDEQRLEYWREARSCYERGHAVAAGLRESGLIQPGDDTQPEDFAEAIAKCDAAMGPGGL